MALARSDIRESMKEFPEDKRKPGRFGKTMFDIPRKPVASEMFNSNVNTKVAATEMAHARSHIQQTGKNVTWDKRKPGRFGKLMMENPQKPVTSVPEFARALRADVFPESYPGDFPAHWSRKRTNSWDSIDSIIELYSSRDEPQHSTMEDPTLELVVPEMVSSTPETKVKSNETTRQASLEQKHVFAMEQSSGTRPSVPEDSEQVVASAEVLGQILGDEIQEWKGFWWKGTMEWI